MCNCVYEFLEREWDGVLIFFFSFFFGFCLYLEKWKRNVKNNPIVCYVDTCHKCVNNIWPTKLSYRTFWTFQLKLGDRILIQWAGWLFCVFFSKVFGDLILLLFGLIWLKRWNRSLSFGIWGKTLPKVKEIINYIVILNWKLIGLKLDCYWRDGFSKLFCI